MTTEKSKRAFGQFEFIRSAHPRDAASLHALELLCSQNPWALGGIENELSNPNSIVLILESAGAPPLSASALSVHNPIIGVAVASLVLDELHILEVAVHPDYRGRGQGAALIKHLLSAASGRGVVRALLEVRASNNPAIRLYEKLGFVRDGVRKGYYQNGEDAVLMSLRINS